MTRAFGDAFFAKPREPRVLALEVPRGYRDAAEAEREVTFPHPSACTACMRKGCGLCELAGWTVASRTLHVVVPPGATPGTRIDLADAGDVVVEVVEAGPRADELRAAAKDHEHKLEMAWEMDRSARRRSRRALRVAIGAIGPVLAVYVVASWLAKPGTGEPCTADAECRSGHCMRLMTVTLAAAPRLDGQRCTSACATDLDCPSSMRCAVSETRLSDRQYVTGAPPGLACIPKSF